MHRVRPSAVDVDAAWKALDLKAKERIFYWFEDDFGNARVGVTDGTNDWDVDVVISGDTYTVKDDDWRQREIICVG
jgi:hypothetical protein